VEIFIQFIGRTQRRRSLPVFHHAVISQCDSPRTTHTHTRTHTRQSPRAAQTASSIIYRHHNTDAVLTGKAPSVTRAQPSIGNEGQPGPAEGAGDGRSAPLRPGAAYWDLRVMYDAVARGRVDDIKLPGYIC